MLKMKHWNPTASNTQLTIIMQSSLRTISPVIDFLFKPPESFYLRGVGKKNESAQLPLESLFLLKFKFLPVSLLS